MDAAGFGMKGSSANSLLKNGRAKLLLSRMCYTARLGGSLALPETGFSTGS